MPSDYISDGLTRIKYELFSSIHYLSCLPNNQFQIVNILQKHHQQTTTYFCELALLNFCQSKMVQLQILCKIEKWVVVKSRKIILAYLQLVYWTFLHLDVAFHSDIGI